MKKQLLLLVMMLLPMVASINANAHDFEAVNAEGKIIYYVKNSDGLTVSVSYRGGSYSSYSNEYSGNIDIPESITYNGILYSVTSIGDYAFCGCSDLTSVTISNSVTSIGMNAFYGCTDLPSITIPNSVTIIEYGAFSNCSRLTSVTIGNSVTSIGHLAFSGCSGLISITIPNSVKSIRDSAFKNCSGLTSITIPNSVTSIGEGAFSGCSGLKHVNRIINDITSWCKNADPISYGDSYSNPLYYASNLHLYTDAEIEITNLIIPDGITSIRSSAFSKCTSITSVTIPNSVTSIGEAAFQNCSGIQSVLIGNGVTSIPAYVFGTGKSLKSLTIGSGVLSISNNAFKQSSSSWAYNPIKTIWLTNTPPSGYSSAAGKVNYVANDQYTLLNNKTVYSFLSSIFEVNGVKYVPISPSERTCDAIDCAYNESEEEIHIGKTVSFKGISLSVLQIRPYACYNNCSIKDVQLGLSGNIGEYAFYQCTGIQTLEIDNAVTDIYSFAFSSCSALESATIGNKGKLDDYAFQDCSTLLTATIGEQVTSIGNYTFGGCSKLQSIIIPDAVASIGGYAFSGCSSMTEAKIGNGVNAINQYTFQNCSSLTKIQIGSNVKTIGQYAFYNCSAMPLIKIPKAVTTINNYVFSGCNGLKAVIMDDDEGEGAELQLGSNSSNPLFSSCPLDSIYIGRNITYSTSSSYGYSPFYRNTSLRAVTITDKETEISANEFYGCTNLKKVSIGESVTTIGNYAFSGCSSLDIFSFGSKVSSIGKEAFSDCMAMTRLISRATTPPSCDSQALDDISKWTCELTIPEGTLSVYQAADQWKDFFFVNEQNEEGGEDPVIPEDKKCATPTIIYSNGKVSFTCETEGVEFVPNAMPVGGTTYENGELSLPSTYRISVYAKKVGYLDSDTAIKEVTVTGGGGLTGDVNSDGEVNVGDIVTICNIMAGKE